MNADWRPIETAPAFYRILLGRVGHPYVYVGWWSKRYKHWAIGDGAMDFFDQPTHWAHAPDAPRNRNKP